MASIWSNPHACRIDGHIGLGLPLAIDAGKLLQQSLRDCFRGTFVRLVGDPVVGQASAAIPDRKPVPPSAPFQGVPPDDLLAPNLSYHFMP